MKYELTSQVDTDGILRFALELGEEYANKCVRLTVASLEPPSGKTPLSDEGWSKGVEELAGKWVGEFERPPQGETAQVGANGLLTLPLGKVNANRLVRVTVEPAEPTDRSARRREEWLRFIENTAGKITDPTFERQPQGEYEQRDEL